MNNNKKRILCLIDSLGAGGAQRQIIGLASLLKDKDYDVTVAFYHPDFFFADSLTIKGVPYVFLNRAQRSATRIIYIANYIRKTKPDVVIAYLFSPSICACLTKMINHNFKLIVSERNTTQVTGRNEKIRFKLFEKSNYIVPNSYSQENYIKGEFPRLSEKLVTIPNFVDLDFFSPPVVKNRRDIPEIMVAASIWAPKNTLGFIDVVGTLRDKGYKFHISWYGLNTVKMDYINQCKEKIAHLKVGDYITLKEKSSQIRDLYREADYFCLPSFYEGTPNVICEAIASGLPVVCSDVCDNPRYVVENENGFLFNPKSSESMARAFEHLFSLNSEEYRAFSIRSRQIAENKLSKELFIEAYINLIENDLN